MTEPDDDEGTELFKSMDPAAYWIVEVKGLEWHYIMSTILRTLPLDEQGAQAALLYGQDAASLTYYLPRKFVSSALLARKTGLAIEEIKATPRIKLTVTPKDLPNPTVSYWGEA